MDEKNSKTVAIDKSSHRNISKQGYLSSMRCCEETNQIWTCYSIWDIKNTIWSVACFLFEFLSAILKFRCYDLDASMEVAYNDVFLDMLSFTCQCSVPAAIRTIPLGVQILQCLAREQLHWPSSSTDWFFPNQTRVSRASTTPFTARSPWSKLLTPASSSCSRRRWLQDSTSSSSPVKPPPRPRRHPERRAGRNSKYIANRGNTKHDMTIRSTKRVLTRS